MGTTCTSYCVSHNSSYYKVSCYYYRGRNRNTLSLSLTTGNVITASNWNSLRDYIIWERGQRNLSTPSITGAVTAGSTVITDDVIESLRDNLEAIAGAPNRERPASSYVSVCVNRTRTDGGTITGGTTTAAYYATSSTNWYQNSGSAQIVWQNINDTDYNNTTVTASAIQTLINKLNETMADCVCNADCGTYAICSCYTTHCSSYYY